MTHKPAYACDLHTHTQRSDGNDSYIELIDHASSIGMKAIAITDHDIAPAQTVKVGGETTEGETSWGETVSPVEYARERGLILLPGAEYSCDTDVDDVHIVALGCDWDNPGLRGEEERMRHSKIQGYRRLTELLTERGFRLSWEELLENGGKADGKAIEESEVQRKHIFEALARKGYASSWKEAKLLVRNDPELNIKREKTDPLDAIRLIHGAGGVAILAHPYLIDVEVARKGLRIRREDYISALIGAGLDGIEASYSYDKTSYSGNLSPEKIEREIRASYGSILSIISGGSDYHADAKKGTASPRCLGERGVDWEYFSAHPGIAKIAGLD
ncbi:MAG: PHP domain-containing protein [Rectinemataceae bacterium]